jgi:hypothetical protein
MFPVAAAVLLPGDYVRTHLTKDFVTTSGEANLSIALTMAPDLYS